MVLKHHIPNSFYVDRTDSSQLLLLEGMVVMKELILTVCTFGGYGGLERTDF